MEEASNSNFHYFIDGAVAQITDFSKCMMPPPMSMIKYDFGSAIAGAVLKEGQFLVITE